MRTISSRSFTFAAIALLAFGVSAAAQDKSSIAPLSAPEVRQLVASALPADQLQLSAHFAALADRYTAQAKIHTSMAQQSVGNASRNLNSGLSAHCKKLAELNTEAVSTLRELQNHYRQLAAGKASVGPVAGAGFEAGAGAGKPTEKDMVRLAASAKTPADHQDLEAYFLALSKDYTAATTEHTAMAQAYRGLPRSPNAGMAAHCDRLARLSGEAATEAAAAAGLHHEMVTGSR